MSSIIPTFTLEADTATPVTLFPLDEPEDFVTEHLFHVLRAPADGEPAVDGSFCAGQVHYYHLKLDIAINLAVAWRDIFETLPCELASLYDLLFLKKYSLCGYPCFRSTIAECDDTPPVSSDILVFAANELPDSSLGLAALETVLRHSPNCVAVSYLPDLIVGSPAEIEAAYLRMAGLKRLGFRRLPKTPFALVNLSLKNPSVLATADRLPH